ncbi:hypothetical protein B0F90DRAFT_1822064 [Multifurca ochricompacta]|uniref:Uncharacterized protein n=1 Tax=Multifurca ochricompacta TaxID=376703 RepID=A0AAD4LXG5_9AGAM|nr:hypothetical protein B0F90DRAFT_1822064 [Multifurca ochricompacta]
MFTTHSAAYNETNTVTAAVAIVSFVLYVAFPNEIYYTCTWAFVSFAFLALLPADEGREVPGSLGNCKIDDNVMYSNTLLVSLNNRIYFRDHPTPKHSRNNAQTVEPTSSHVTTSSDTIKLGDYPHSVDIEKGKGIDAISTNSVSSNA